MSIFTCCPKIPNYTRICLRCWDVVAHNLAVRKMLFYNNRVILRSNQLTAPTPLGSSYLRVLGIWVSEHLFDPIPTWESCRIPSQQSFLTLSTLAVPEPYSQAIGAFAPWSPALLQPVLVGNVSTAPWNLATRAGVLGSSVSALQCRASFCPPAIRETLLPACEPAQHSLTLGRLTLKQMLSFWDLQRAVWSSTDNAAKVQIIFESHPSV